MKRVRVRKNSYVDSVFLMLLSKELKEMPGVAAATVAMGTPMNAALLADQGYGTADLAGISPADLVIALDCPSEAVFEAAMAAAEDNLSGKKKRSAQAGQGVGVESPASLDAALEVLDGANIALISLPGMYAPREVRKALNAGLHVMLFSDNVSLEDEITLKALAREKGLLMMGPDCGTAIIDGKPLCFANVVGRGPVGIVAASGTGLQEVSCLVDRYGSGVSQGIGTGGRDLKNSKVGGATMLMGIAALGADPATMSIVVVSKPPAPDVAAAVVRALELAGKPAVVHFIGLSAPAGGAAPAAGKVRWADNLEEAARLGVELAGGAAGKGAAGGARAAGAAAGASVGTQAPAPWPFQASRAEIDSLAEAETRDMAKSQKYIRGYYTGGTLADEAWILLHRLTGAVYSNNQTDPRFVPPDPKKSIGHTVVDLGDDVFTLGKPHPMIDPSTRTDRMDEERGDAEIAVMLLDCVLGYGSHADPAGALAPSILAAKRSAEQRGGCLSVIASVTGTAGDYQGLDGQIKKLKEAGVVVMPSNYQASMLAVRIMERVAGRAGGAVARDGAAGVAAAPRGGGPVQGAAVLGGAKDGGAAGLRGDGASTPGAGVSAAGAVAAPFDPARILGLFGGLKAVNLGLESFAENLAACGAPVVHVMWKPPAGGDVGMIQVLDRLESRPKVDIEAANAVAVERILSGKPVIRGIATARDVVPGMREDLILHAGPPVGWDRMCGPMRGAVIGGLIYEGLAANQAEAEALAASGRIDFEPCHHHSSVGPMAGIMTSRMPVWILENETYGNRAYATLNEGLGKVLRYGAFSVEVLDRLAWMEKELAPILAKAVERHGPIDLRSLIVQALQMGDEGHNRNRAGTSLLIRELAPHLVLLGEDPQAVSRVLAFMHGNDHFFLNLTMPASKCVLDAAAGIPGSTILTVQARNGTEFGIQVSGLPGRWFTGPAGVVKGLYLPGFGPEDAALDIGDSVITETAGIGGFAMAAAPAIVKFVGGSPADAIAYTLAMYRITAAENREYRIPVLDFRGTPTGIDLRKVVETGVLPVVNTGIAHKTPGVGMVGAGLVEPPVNCYRDALVAFAETYAP